jgi:cytosine/adenosine deaminase-related metal-dependent hydrolase
MPLATHLAESREEGELLEYHRGPFVPFLSELGVWDEHGLVIGAQEVLQLTAQTDNTLLVHGNYLDPETAIPPRVSIIYCPRTHAAFGHAPYPLRALLGKGVRVALGTDSLASNPDLDVLAEARFVRLLYPDLPGATLLRMATLSGALALGWQNETGSLTPGKSADLVVLELPDRANDVDPYESILSSSARVQAVLFRGKWVYLRDKTTLVARGKGAERLGFAAPGP